MVNPARKKTAAAARKPPPPSPPPPELTPKELDYICDPNEHLDEKGNWPRWATTFDHESVTPANLADAIGPVHGPIYPMLRPDDRTFCTLLKTS